MSIWEYKCQSDEIIETIIRSKKYVFCKTDLETIYRETMRITNNIKEINVCPICGWWTIWQSSSNLQLHNERQTINLYGANGSLKKMDLNDIETPLCEIEQYLLAKYAHRFDLHPRLFEQVVGDVFKNIGYQTEVTSYSNDGGIDVILYKGHSRVGVQVKRHKDFIKVGQIRELIGALIEKDMTQGVFVTTSDFQRGVNKLKTTYEKKGYAISLVNGTQFYDALKISSRTKYNNYNDFLTTIGDVELSTVYEDEADYI